MDTEIDVDKEYNPNRFILQMYFIVLVECLIKEWIRITTEELSEGIQLKNISLLFVISSQLFL